MTFLKKPLIRAVCVAQSLILMVPAAPAYAATKTITCDSRDFERVRCDISNKSVRLKRQLSVSSCREGRDWGYDKRGVWVYMPNTITRATDRATRGMAAPCRGRPQP